MFKSKEKYNDKKRLQDIVLLTAISGCIIDIANGSSSYKSSFSHAKHGCILPGYETAID